MNAASTPAVPGATSLVRVRAAAALLLAGAAILLSGCATTGDSDPRDPFEPANRAVYKFNDTVDRAILKPVAQGYKAVIPEPARNCVGNVFGNLSDIWTSANQLLQGKPHEAGNDICRVAINTTVGILGCFDVASKMGLEKHNEDFGQTLGRWGVPPGPFVMLPILGPSTVRDTVGLIPDLYVDPVGNIGYVPTRNTAEVIRIVDKRASLLDASNVFEGAALDPYLFLRDGYLARRRSQVYDGDPPDEDTPPAKPAGADKTSSADQRWFDRPNQRVSLVTAGH